MSPQRLTALERMKADGKRVAALAARLGAILAVVCHVLPPHFRVACHTLASLCGAGG